MAIAVTNYVNIEETKLREATPRNTPLDDQVRLLVSNPIFKQAVADNASGISEANQTALEELGGSKTVVPALNTLASATVKALTQAGAAADAAELAKRDAYIYGNALKINTAEIPYKGNRSGASSTSTTINFRPRFFGLASGASITKFTIETAASNPTGFDKIFAVITRYGDSSWQAISQVSTYPETTSTKATFQFENPVTLDYRDDYYFIKFYAGDPPKDGGGG